MASDDNDERKFLNVRIILQPEGNKVIEQLVEDVQITDCIEDPSSALNLRKLLLILKQDYNFSFQNKQIYYYLSAGEIYVNCGIDPINEQIRVRPQNYEGGLTVRGKDLGVSLVHRLMSFQNISANSEEKERNCADEMAEKSKCRRTKERRIGHIIDKVIEWRKYYSGLINQKNQQIKYSLEDAARQVKISKKSLDDYLFQIRFGHKYGFNFNEHYNDKVGVLRDFVRHRKKNDKVDIKSRKTMNRIGERDEE